MRFPLTLTVLGIAAFSGNAVATDAPQHGKTLHDSHCIACHANMTGGKPEQIYTRANRRVTDRNKLWMQVQRCEQNLKLDFFDDDIEQVTDYLDKSYYHFGK